MLMVAHDVNPILPYLDRVVYLAERRRGRRCPPAEVITAADPDAGSTAPRSRCCATSDGRLVVVGRPESAGRAQRPAPSGAGRHRLR